MIGEDLRCMLYIRVLMMCLRWVDVRYVILLFLQHTMGTDQHPTTWWIQRLMQLRETDSLCDERNHLRLVSLLTICERGHIEFSISYAFDHPGRKSAERCYLVSNFSTDKLISILRVSRWSIRPNWWSKREPNSDSWKREQICERNTRASWNGSPMNNLADSGFQSYPTNCWS